MSLFAILDLAVGLNRGKSGAVLSSCAIGAKEQLNVCRENMQIKELWSWSLTFGLFQNISRFGILSPMSKLCTRYQLPPTASPQSVTFTLPKTAGGYESKAELLIESGSVQVESGRLMDTLEPLQRRCYKVLFRK